MHPKRSLVLFLSLISISKHCLKVETRFIFSAYGEFKTYIIIPYLHYFLYSWRTRKISKENSGMVTVHLGFFGFTSLIAIM